MAVLVYSRSTQPSWHIDTCNVDTGHWTHSAQGNCHSQLRAFVQTIIYEWRVDDYHIADGGRLGVRVDRIQTGAGIEGRHRHRAHQGHGGGDRGLLSATPAHLRHLLVKIYGQPHGHLIQISTSVC